MKEIHRLRNVQNNSEQKITQKEKLKLYKRRKVSPSARLKTENDETRHKSPPVSG